MEEYNYQLMYKPGKADIAADYLSRPPLPDEIHSITPTEHSDDSSSHNLIPTVETPINAFRNQLLLKVEDAGSYQLTVPFENYHRHRRNQYI